MPRRLICAPRPTPNAWAASAAAASNKLRPNFERPAPASRTFGVEPPSSGPHDVLFIYSAAPVADLHRLGSRYFIVYLRLDGDPHHPTANAGSRPKLATIYTRARSGRCPSARIPRLKGDTTTGAQSSVTPGHLRASTTSGGTYTS